MKIALTGGSGFLGRYLIDRFTRIESHDLVALTRRPSPATGRGGHAVTWCRGDLRDADSLGRFVADCDAVVHAALDRGDAGFMRHPDDPVDYFDTNVLGSLRLIEAAIAAGVPRFVFISSGAVHEQVLSDRPLDETHPLRPGSLYGSAKASVETLMHAYGLSGRLTTSALRPTSIYGVAEPVQESKWFDSVTEVAAGKSVQATGGAKCVHAADVAAAVAMLLATSPERVAGQTFNCCDRFISEYEVATIAKELSGSDSAIQGPPKTSANVMSTEKIRALGMTFGEEQRLRDTIAELIRPANANRT